MMEAREIYWNVGHGVLIPMYLLAGSAVGFMAWRLIIRARGAAASGKPYPSLALQPGRALWQTLFQLKTLKGGGLPGLGHALFFWCFLILTAGTTLVFIQADFTDLLFGYKFLTGGFYKIFSLALDLAGLAAILAMAGLFIRRYFFRPAGLASDPADALIHGLLFAALATGFVVEGLRMAATELEANMALAQWSPVGLILAKAFYGAGPQALASAHLVMWWAHFFICLAFFAAIPMTKLRHIFYVPINYALAPQGRTGKLMTLALEDESAEKFGASAPADLLWKDLFDSEACVKCKRCQDQCPAHLTGKPLSPMKLVQDVGAALALGKDASLIQSAGEDAVWACLTCRACEAACPAGVEHVRKIMEMRRNMALMEGKFPGEEVARAMNAIEVNGNPLGAAMGARDEWAQGLAWAGNEMEVLYFTGCYACYDLRNRKVARAFASILAKLGVKAGSLGNKEKCCGEPARKMGNEYLYQTVARENIEAIRASGAKKIVTTCPHCFHTLDAEYRDLGLDPDISVEHYSTFLAARIGRFKSADPMEPVTYHDSCYMGRHNGVFRQPRELLAAIGAPVREMARHGEQSFCCGAGGGRILAEEKLGSRINVMKAQMAGDTGAGIVVSNCPFCMTMLEDGVKTAGLEERLKPMDLAELLAERI